MHLPLLLNTNHLIPPTSSRDTMTSFPFDDKFDIIPSGLGSRLRGDSFRVIQLISMVAENPGRNAHYLEELQTTVAVMADYLESAGFKGDGGAIPGDRAPDVIDFLFEAGAAGIKERLRSAFAPSEDDDYEDDEMSEDD